MKTRLTPRISRQYNPPIYRDSGKLDTDYHYRQTKLAVRAALKIAANVAENPYSDEVCAFGGDSPKTVAEKIASAIRKL